MNDASGTSDVARPESQPVTPPTGADTRRWSDATCDVWMLADAASSRWSRRIDWYLNFQAMKAETHQTAEVSAHIKAIDERWPTERELELKLDPHAPLMIASHGRLPCSKAIFFPFTGEIKGWVISCVQVWRGLGRPRTRVFLPDTVSEDDFRASWVKVAGFSESIPESVHVSALEA